MFRQVQTKVNLEKHIISLMTDVPFFAEISRHVKKMPTKDLPTAAVAFNKVTEDLVMGWNPDFVEKLGNLQTRGLLVHELYHIIFGHLNVRRMEPPTLWNVATDCAINSLIMDAAKRRNNSNFVSSKSDSPLPNGCIIPGEWSTHPSGREMTQEEKTAAPLAAIIAKLPTLKSSEYYFHKILEEAEKLGYTRGKGGPNGDGDIDDLLGSGEGQFDDHSFWDSIPEEQRPYVEGKIRDILEKAVRRADSQAEGWGNIPAEIAAEIRKSVSRIINWRQVLRQFTGSLVRGRRRTSLKRINKRYPYIHPGVAKGFVAKLIICIDQSGSVDDNMLNMFFAELRSLNKNIEIDILPFDCAADIKDVYTWKRGQCPAAKRTRAGGTDFNAPTQIINDPKNRGRWDGMLIMTDGEAPAPGPSRIKRGWVLGQGQKMLFDTNELVIKLDDGKQQNQGAWR